MSEIAKASEGGRVHVGGRVVPFTFWPEEYIRSRPFSASDPWQCMITVLLSEEPTPANSRCRCYIEQSRDFWKASQDASIGTRPLMLYYSYLNLAKAFLLHRSGEGMPPNVEDHHGLYYTNRITSYSDLDEITFDIPAPDPGKCLIYRELVDQCGFSAGTRQPRVPITDMLYQIPNLHDAFIAPTQLPRAFFSVELEFRSCPTADCTWVWGSVDVSVYSRAEETVLRDFITACPEFHLVEGNSEEVCFETRQVDCRQVSATTVLRRELIEPIRQYLWSVQTDQGYRYFIHIRKDFTAQVASNYAVMYTLGMIVRYTPELIDQLEREWIIHEYLATQPLQYAYFLGSGIVRNEIVPNPLATL